MAAEVATQGNRLSNRFQQPMSVPDCEGGHQPAVADISTACAGISERRTQAHSQCRQSHCQCNHGSEHTFRTITGFDANPYIQALEAQLADMRAALDGKQPNGQH